MYIAILILIGHSSPPSPPPQVLCTGEYRCSQPQNVVVDAVYHMPPQPYTMYVGETETLDVCEMVARSQIAKLSKAVDVQSILCVEKKPPANE